MDPFFTPADINGKILSISQFVNMYINFFIDADDLNSPTRSEIQFFFNSQDIKSFFPQHIQSEYVFIAPRLFHLNGISVEDSEKIQIILDAYNFLKAILTIYTNIRVYKNFFSKKNDFNNIEKMALNSEKRAYFIANELPMFFSYKGFFNKEDISFSSNLFDFTHKVYISINEHSNAQPTLLILLNKFKAFLVKKYKSTSWFLKRKQIEDELEKFCSNIQGFALSKEQKIAIVQFCLSFNNPEDNEDTPEN